MTEVKISGDCIGLDPWTQGVSIFSDIDASVEREELFTITSSEIWIVLWNDDIEPLFELGMAIREQRLLSFGEGSDCCDAYIMINELTKEDENISNVEFVLSIVFISSLRAYNVTDESRTDASVSRSEVVVDVRRVISAEPLKRRFRSAFQREARIIANTHDFSMPRILAITNTKLHLEMID